MANANRLTPLETFTFRLTPTVEREYRRREVFPDLRLENAPKIINGATGVFEISAKLAEELLDDVKAQRARRKLLPRGLLVAYNSVEDQASAGLKMLRRQGLWDSPGIETVEKRVRAASAIFHIGDRVLFWRNVESSIGATVLSEFGFCTVRAEGGHYIDADGQRVDYRPGYILRLDDRQDGRTFATAFDITRNDCKPSHLRLVSA